MRVDSETTDNKYLNDIPRYLVPKLQLGNAYYQTTISTPSKTASSPVSK
jgi:hypothetical protein